MNTARSCRIGAVVLLMLGVVVEHLPAQEDFGSRLGVRRGGEVYYDPVGPGVLFDALDPAVKKWYVPQELFNEYQWRQQDYNELRPAELSVLCRDHPRRRVFLRHLWELHHPAASSFTTGAFPRRRHRVAVCSRQTGLVAGFRAWFIASDQKGQYAYALTIGDRIRTTLTPMTFSKPTFAGIQFDLATDKYETTVPPLASQCAWGGRKR